MKRGQMELSFGMIFSILLIVAFIGFAFYAILKLLDTQCVIKQETFINDLQSDVDKAWKSDQSSQPVEYLAPSGIEYVCFVDIAGRGSGANKNIFVTLETYSEDKDNSFFYPKSCSKNPEGFELKHINLEKTTSENNPFCVKVSDGKIKLVLKKEFKETPNLVTITK